MLKPTGLRSISPTVWRKKTATSHRGPITPWAVSLAAGTISTKDSATKSRPSANFTGLDGCRAPSRIQRKANTGASRMTQMELTDCHQEEGKAWPKTSLRVNVSAKSEMVEPVCSKIAQKISAAKKKMRIAARRLLSWSGRKAK